LSYTIKSAAYANADHTAAIIDTEEAAAVLLSARDTPREWAAMLAWGAPIPFALPAPSIVSQILALEATITERRLREAVLTDEGKVWLASVDAQIAALRGQL